MCQVLMQSRSQHSMLSQPLCPHGLYIYHILIVYNWILDVRDRGFDGLDWVVSGSCKGKKKKSLAAWKKKKDISRKMQSIIPNSRLTYQTGQVHDFWIHWSLLRKLALQADRNAATVTGDHNREYMRPVRLFFKILLNSITYHITGPSPMEWSPEMKIFFQKPRTPWWKHL